jgi:HK97 family phage portal protein
MRFGPDLRFDMDGPPQVQNAAVAITSNGQSMLDMFAASPNAVGPAVTDQSALQVGTVYACLEKLGGVVLQLPLHHYRMDEKGERQAVFPHSPIWWLLNESPTDAWTASSWKEWIVRCVKLRGDQHTEILRNRRGEPVGLLPHHPDRVLPRAVGRRLRYDVWDAQEGRAYGVDQDDMLHFTGFGFDGLCSVSAIKWAARNAISNSLASAQFMAKALGEHGMPRLTLQYPRSVNSVQQDEIRYSFTKAYLENSSQRRLPLILSEGATATPLDISAVDMEVMAARKMDKGEICEALGVPPIIIGDSEKTSSWGTGVEQVTLGWVRFSVQPMLARWEEEINRKLFRRAGQYVEFSLAALLRGDSKAQAEAYRAALGGPGTGDGWMPVNEIRKLQNLPPDPDPQANLIYRAPRDTATPRKAAA